MTQTHSKIALRARRRLAWLLTPVLALVSLGGRFCWCPDGENGHDHGIEPELHADATHDHDEVALDHAHGHPESPTHDHHTPGGGCECVGSDTPATEASKGSVGSTHGAARIDRPWDESAAPAPAPALIARAPGWGPKGNAPPLFVLNCSYLC